MVNKPDIEGMPKVQLPGDFETIVDAKAIARFKGLKWSTSYNRQTGLRYVRAGNQLLHRLILGVEDGLEVDHRNGNTLDNRLRNLRPATRTQNQQNRKVQRRAVHKEIRYKGVHPIKPNGFMAVIRIAGKRTELGRFASQEEAAAAYDSAARTHFGEFARVNGVAEAPTRRTKSSPRTSVGRKRNPSTHPYKGITGQNRSGTYSAGFCHRGKRRNLGAFATIEEAAAAYDRAAFAVLGDRAVLNFPTQHPTHQAHAI